MSYKEYSCYRTFHMVTRVYANSEEEAIAKADQVPVGLMEQADAGSWQVIVQRYRVVGTTIVPQ